MKNNLKIFSFLTLFAIAFQSCEDTDVPNFNDPDLAATLAESDNYPASLNGAYLDWWDAIHKYNPYMTLSVAADHGASSWGNFNMRNVGTVSEPYGLGDHVALDNTQTAPSTAYLTQPWYGLYGAIGTANDVLRGILVNGNTVMDGEEDITQQTIAQALTIRGLSYGYLGLLFDRAFIVTETTDLSSFSYAEENLSTYTDLKNQATADLDQAISIGNGLSSFEISQINGLTLGKTEAIKLMNTYAAKFEALTSRTSTENSATDWSKVASYASNGIDFDFAPIGDGGTVWWSAFFLHGNPGWIRLDQKMVNMMDPRQPYPYPAAGYDRPTTPGQDTRIGEAGSGAYFEYAGTAPFRAERGIYFFSFYAFTKHIGYRTDLSGPMMAIPQADNDLLLAEAYVRTGTNLSAAADLINKTRVSNGGMSPVSSSDSNLLEVIKYERLVEAYEAPGNPFFEARRLGELGNKQFTQFPIPALELNVLTIPLYTFGGE